MPSLPRFGRRVTRTGYAQIRDSFPTSGEMLALSNSAFRLHISAICYCSRYELDGALPAVVVRHLMPRYRRAALAELLEHGVWQEFASGYIITGLGTAWKLAPLVQSRPKIPHEIRAAVMDRDGGMCQECGTTDRLSLDHIWPYSKGGGDTVDNLRVLCRPCNSRKGARV